MSMSQMNHVRLRPSTSSLALFAFLILAGCVSEFQKGEDAYQAADYSAAFAAWEPLAQKGDAQAQTLIASMYADGKGVDRDEAKAFEWYSKAAEQHVARAQHALGVMYENGEGVVRDDAAAAEWYRDAADQGY